MDYLTVIQQLEGSSRSGYLTLHKSLPYVLVHPGFIRHHFRNWANAIQAGTSQLLVSQDPCYNPTVNLMVSARVVHTVRALKLVKLKLVTPQMDPVIRSIALVDADARVVSYNRSTVYHDLFEKLLSHN